MVSGWNNCKIHAFAPQIGKLLFTVHNSRSGAADKMITAGTGSQSLRLCCRMYRVCDEWLKTMGRLMLLGCNAARQNEASCHDVYGMLCMNVAPALQNGQSVISGWNDGKIRAFAPQSGKLLYTIHDAHQGAVTAIAGTPDSTGIISGGELGTVRLWAINRDSQVMQYSRKVRSVEFSARPGMYMLCYSRDTRRSLLFNTT